MARRIIFKDGGLSSDTIPDGYTALGSDGGDLIKRFGSTFSGGSSITNITPSSIIDITTTKSINYIMIGNVDSSVINSITFNLYNPGNQSIGDQIIIISQPNTSSGFITYTFDSNFYITSCGEPGTVRFSQSRQERSVITFTYDGEIFCSTYDNC